MLSGKQILKSNTSYSSRDFFRQPCKKVDFAILSPMPEELEFFQKTFSQYPHENIKLHEFEFMVYEYNKKRILLSHTGLGTTFAASVATMIYHHFHPSYFLLLGTAGGINPKLNIRDVIIVEKAFEAEIQDAFKLLKGTPFESSLTHPLNKKMFPPIYSADEELLAIASSIDFQNIKVHRGTAVSSNTFPAPRELFEKIKQESPYSIDMETSAIYQVAWLLKVRALAVRGISNVLNHDGTDERICEADVQGGSKAAATVLLKILDTLIHKYDLQLARENKLELSVDTHINHEVAKVIKYFNLQPHPEGGFYARTYKSNHLINSSDKNRYVGEQRSAGSSIYYLLQGSDFSAWHKLKSDETWNHYKGSAVEIHVINTQGMLTTHLLGDPTIYHGAAFQVAVPANNWFAAAVTDKLSYSLVGCTVCPGFELTDWEMADRSSLIKQFPQHESLINQFTRLPQNHEDAITLQHSVIKSKL